MCRTIAILITSLFSGAALLSPVFVHAQQASPTGKLDAVMTPAESQSAAPNPFQRPGGSPHSADDSSAHADSVPLLQFDGPGTRAVVQYAFAASPGFYRFRREQGALTDWDSALTGVFAAYLNRSGTAYARMTTNLEQSGERRDAGTPGDPGAQSLTLEWELARLVPSRLGPLEFAASLYRQRLLSYAAFPNTAVDDTLTGYPVSSAGAETSVTLPDKNLTLTFRYGSQHLEHASDRDHVKLFELSWSW